VAGAVTETAVRLQGFRELQRAFARADTTLLREFQTAMKKVAEPVREEAEHLAGTEIRNVLSPTASVDWWRMRVGITRVSLYVAPNERGRLTKRNPGRYHRPNFGTLLMEKAMEPALAHNEARAVVAVDHVLASVGRVWEAAA
jgi:hypothetical protein